MKVLILKSFLLLVARLTIVELIWSWLLSMNEYLKEKKNDDKSYFLNGSWSVKVYACWTISSSRSY